MRPIRSKPQPPPELSLYRSKTVRMLRRYFNMSVELGRLPSILGRELLPSSNAHCHPVAFEDLVVFVLDIEHCILRLRRDEQQLITRVILQEHTHERAARLLHWPVIKVERRLPEVLDKLTGIFLSSRLMKPFPQCDAVEAEDEELPTAQPVETALVDSIFAMDEGDDNTAALYENDSQGYRHSPVEIFLSRPLDVTILFNSHVQ